MRKTLIAVMVAVMLSSGVALAGGECEEPSEFWYWIDTITFQDPGSWQMWWNGGTALCMDGGMVY